jgi:hypothetical protein
MKHSNIHPNKGGLTMETKTRCDLACEILQRTQDGDDLAPEHLYLLQCAVNDHLTESGIALFCEIHRKVMNNEYRKPWLQGVEHLTRDHEGYVYWKGQHIEHWSGDLPYSEEGKKQAEELARRCKMLEARGNKINSVTVIWAWKETTDENQS